MRRYLVLVVFAIVVVSATAGLLAGPRDTDSREPLDRGPVAVRRAGVPGAGLRDEAAMVLVGTALIGLAAAVRRAA